MPHVEKSMEPGCANIMWKYIWSSVAEFVVPAVNIFRKYHEKLFTHNDITKLAEFFNFSCMFIDWRELTTTSEESIAEKNLCNHFYLHRFSMLRWLYMEKLLNVDVVDLDYAMIGKIKWETIYRFWYSWRRVFWVDFVWCGFWFGNLKFNKLLTV